MDKFWGVLCTIIAVVLILAFTYYACDQNPKRVIDLEDRVATLELKSAILKLDVSEIYKEKTWWGLKEEDFDNHLTLDDEWMKMEIVPLEGEKITVEWNGQPLILRLKE